MAYTIVATAKGGPEVLEKREITVVDPGAGEVRIRQTAVGLNFIDTYFRSGLYPWPYEPDFVLGGEGAGVIEAVGEGVSGFKEGDRVAYTTAHGAYTTHRVIEARHVVVLPDGVPDTVAAASMLKGLTAHYLLHRSFAVAAGQTVLFHAAAGGVGQIAGQWLAAKGVKAIGTAGGSEKTALAKARGYAHAIDYVNEDFVERVKAITGGVGVDAVYDSVGADTWRGSLKCLKTFGSFVCFGQSSGPIKDFAFSDLAAGSFTATRPILFHFTADRGYLEAAAAELFACIADGTIAVDVHQTFPLDAAADAHRMLESRKSTGSTVLIP